MTDDGKPLWNDELARQFIGKHIIIGVTRVTADDEPLGQQQMHGDIVAVDEKNGIGIRSRAAERCTGCHPTCGPSAWRRWASTASALPERSS